MRKILYHPLVVRPTIVDKMIKLSKKDKVKFEELVKCAEEQDLLFHIELKTKKKKAK